MCEAVCCSDNRFEVIEAAKQKLIEYTNIEDNPDEIKVIDTFLFRCWQMGWITDDNVYSH